MANKKMLQIPINRYEKLPSWLQVILFCFMLLVFEILGSLLGAVILGVLSAPVALLDPAFAKLVEFTLFSIVSFCFCNNFSFSLG